jgi:hypothetical protein
MIRKANGNEKKGKGFFVGKENGNKKPRIIPIEIENELQLKASLLVQGVLSKENFQDEHGNPLQSNSNVMGVDDEKNVCFFNEGYKKFSGIDYRIEVAFEKDTIRFVYGIQERKLSDKMYSYQEFYKFQKDFMNTLQKLEKGN